MFRSLLKFLKYGFLTVLILNACGTREYASQPVENGEENIIVSPVIENQQRVEEQLVEQASPEGYLWEGMGWVGVPDEGLSEFKCKLSDNVESNDFNILGTTIVGGAILGVVVRASGSWFFGGPIDSEVSHWFWKGLNKSFKYTGQGMVRGGLFASSCYLLLTGVHPISYNGLLGPEFGALSSSITLGGMASMATHPFARRLMSADWASPESKIGKLIYGQKFVGQGFERFEDWSTTSEFGQGIRYKVIPSISIVGMGSGVGFLVYNYIQKNVDSNIDSNRVECLDQKHN